MRESVLKCELGDDVGEVNSTVKRNVVGGLGGSGAACYQEG